MSENPIISAILLGVAVGVICVGGLLMGIGILLKTQEPKFPEGTKRKIYYLLGALILAGQFAAAILLLTKTRWVTEQPIATGGGMILTILLASLFLNFPSKNNKK